MAIMRSISLHRHTMLAPQKKGTPNPWAGPRLSIKVMGGSLVRFTVSLNDRSESDEFYGSTFSAQLLSELTPKLAVSMATSGPFEYVVTQSRWSAKTKQEVEGSIHVFRDDKNNCYLKLSVAGQKEVCFPFSRMDRTGITLNGQSIEDKDMSSARCSVWWGSLEDSLKTAAVVLLSMDAQSFGGEENVSSSKQAGGNFDDDIAF